MCLDFKAELLLYQIEEEKSFKTRKILTIRYPQIDYQLKDFHGYFTSCCLKY